jgi:acyl-CoA synthetase (AMP-forming)/AMP-acid ligase II
MLAVRRDEKMEMEYPWFKEFKVCGIPRSLEPYPDEPTHFLLDEAARKSPKMGCVQLGMELTYPEIKDHSDRLAGAMAAMGIQKGDRVATLLPTSMQFVVADTAISKTGAVHVPCSFLESKENLARKFEDGNPKMIICLDEHLETANYLRDYMAAPNIISTNLYDYSSKLPKKPGNWPGPTGAEDSSGGGAGFPTSLMEIIEQSSPVPPKIDFNPIKDLETLLFTGGTTGIAKGCMLTHRNVVANAIQNGAVMGPNGKLFAGNIYVMLGNPFFHAYGHCLFHTMVHLGVSMLLLVDPRDSKGMLDMVRQYHPVLQVGVPTQFMKLLGEDLKKVKVIGISGSAPLRPNVQEDFEKKGGGLVTEGYGLSEVVSVSHYNVSALMRLMGGRKMMRFMNLAIYNPIGLALQRRGAKLLGPKLFGRLFMQLVTAMSFTSRRLKTAKKEERRATIGIPLPDTEVKVLDLESGKPLTWDELISEEKTGEMIINGPQAMLGYWPDEGKGKDEQGFVHTGDVVKMDANGYFAIVDRTKDMVIVSGFKVYTRELDDVLHEHPSVELAASIGVPDPDRPGSELVVVFIQLKDEYKGKVSEEEFTEFLRGRVAKYAVPKKVIFLDEMPLTEVYKIRKVELKDMAVSAIGQGQS